MTGKEFLEQYSIIERKIRSVKIQIDSHDSTLNNYVFVPEIALLTNELKDLVAESMKIKKEILEKIQMVDNVERHQILVKKYIELKSTAQIAREMFMTYQGVRYHLNIGEKEIEKFI